MKKILFSLILTMVILTGCQSASPTPPVENPSQNSVITSPDLSKPLSNPVIIRGKIEGSYFFEGTFPVTLQDANGKVLLQTHATTDNAEWTQEIVPFMVTLSYSAPETKTGTLIFEKDNPSGLPENAGIKTFPVIFTP